MGGESEEGHGGSCWRGGPFADYFKHLDLSGLLDANMKFYRSLRQIGLENSDISINQFSGQIGLVLHQRKCWLVACSCPVIGLPMMPRPIDPIFIYNFLYLVLHHCSA